MCEFESCSRRGELDTTLYYKVCHLLTTGRWFIPGTLVFCTNKTDRHYIAEISLKVALSTIILTLSHTIHLKLYKIKAYTLSRGKCFTNFKLHERRTLLINYRSTKEC